MVKNEILEAKRPKGGSMLVDVAELIEKSETVDFKLRNSKEYGMSVHFLDSKGDYISVRVTDKVDLSAAPAGGKLRYILENYDIFSGVSDKDKGYSGNRWFSFGIAGEGEELESLSVADFMGAKTKVN